MSSFDYNVDNFTISQLLTILELQASEQDEPPETMPTAQIIQATDQYIRHFQQPPQRNPNMSRFFQDVQTKLLQYYSTPVYEREEYTPNTQQTDRWFKHEVLPQDDNPTQKNKVTDRVQQIDVYDNQHVPMNRNQLGVNNQFTVPVAQDTLNPNLENTTRRFICIDSQFRQAAGGTESSATHFTLDLSDPLTDVLSLELYSIQIPYTWYAIDTIYGNTCFWITNQQFTFRISVPPGNYSPAEFCTALTAATLAAGFTPPTATPDVPVATYQSTTAILTLQYDQWSDPNGNLIQGVPPGTPLLPDNNNNNNAASSSSFPLPPFFTFFDATGTRDCYQTNSYPCGNVTQSRTFSGTLGWLMGFRDLQQPIYESPENNSAVAVLNLFGPKYLILVIDDYNQNHINNGLVTITELSKTLPLPSYYNESMPYLCTAPAVAPSLAASVTNIAAASTTNPNNQFQSLQDKTDFPLKKIQQLLPSAPRLLTQAQIYTINEIIKNRSQTTSFRAKAPTNSDTFAILPVKVGMRTGVDIYTDFSSSLKENKRIYFGPVDVERLRVHLLDDKGNTLDLHGADWCITLICTSLYQY